MLHDRGPFRRAALKSYISQMSTPNPKVVFDDHVAEILREQGFDWEEDPRSVYDPQQLYTALQRYATSCSVEWDRHLEYGFGKAFKIFAKPKHKKCLSVLTEKETVVGALKLSKSSGLPLMAKKKDSLPYAFNREEQIRKGIKAPNPCVAYKRTQKGNKTRLVWGYPLEMVIMESRFARPLIDCFARHVTPMAFQMTKAELGARINQNFRETQGTTVCLDYSKYDSTIPKEFIDRAFTILATWFTREDQREYGFATIVKYFVYTPIVMPDGHLYTGKNHGVPSGSYFTQMIDSIVNVALMYAMSSRLGFKFDPEGLYVLGDDSIVRVRGKFSLSEAASYLKGFGMILHDDEKTVIGSEHFLGATWVRGKPDAPISELVAKAIYPERFRKYGCKARVGAEDVLRSYASSYLSAWKLLPNFGFRLFWLDKPRVGEEITPSYWSVADQFFFEELDQARAMRKCDAALSLRLML